MDENLTSAQLLVEVNNAISAILRTGQSYTIGSRSLTRANITELRKLKADLEAEIAAEAENDYLFGNTYAGFFEGR